MKLTFLGTRGYIEARTRRHRMHSSLLVAYYGKEIMLDCGEDWLNRVKSLSTGAILITHGHPDHAGGLEQGAPCKVFATTESWDLMDSYAVGDREVVEPRRPFDLHGMTVEAFPVVHSTRAEAVGYRITAGRAAIFYVPDVVYIPERKQALSGVQIYIGDGATIARSMVRKKGDRLFGHTPIRTQLTWCQKEGVPRAIITHCGSEIVEGDERKLGAKIRQMASERGVAVEIAHDGLEVVLR